MSSTNVKPMRMNSSFFMDYLSFNFQRNIGMAKPL
jgi:hypothetical protein